MISIKKISLPSDTAYTREDIEDILDVYLGKLNHYCKSELTEQNLQSIEMVLTTMLETVINRKGAEQ